ncbi:MAG: hypothetical protein BAJALOKI3v1_930001 [Promethearchaeota archaeon]|nr:MAG: hypothetical protein BAJALOKI3v1_930001 [Candidatus Lokiarchaeota archaeon]
MSLTLKINIDKKDIQLEFIHV